MTAPKGAGGGFTPGPWEIDRLGVVAPDKLPRGQSHRRIARCYAGYPYENDALDAENEANARLIAAAPDLLEAADNALGVLIGCCAPADGIDDRSAILDAQRQLRAALAKAGGES